MNRYTYLDEILLVAYILTTARNLLHFKVISQRSRSHDRFFRYFTIAR